jgi:hypothetical protein
MRPAMLVKAASVEASDGIKLIVKLMGKENK